MEEPDPGHDGRSVLLLDRTGGPMTEAWIIDACRTPRGTGKVGKGSLAHLHTQRLGATVLAALA